MRFEGLGAEMLRGWMAGVWLPNVLQVTWWRFDA